MSIAEFREEIRKKQTYDLYNFFRGGDMTISIPYLICSCGWELANYHYTDEEVAHRKLAHRLDHLEDRIKEAA